MRGRWGRTAAGLLALVVTLSGLATDPQGVWGAGMPPRDRPEGGFADPEAVSASRRRAPYGSGREVPVRPEYQAIEGMRIETSVGYDVDLLGGAVHVTTRVTVTNQSPDEAVSGGVLQSFLERFAVPVVAEATGFSASDAGGGALSVSREATDSPLLAFAVVDLSPDLFFGQTQTIDLRYDIPATGARTSGASRLNDAFVTFPVFALGDPGLTDIRIRVPSSLEVEVVGADMERSVDAGSVELAALDIVDPDAFFVSLIARDDDALESRSLDVAGTEVTVRSWPGDEAWGEFIADLTERGVPVLADVIGVPWPGMDHLEIIETASPYVYGYSGWFRPLDQIIEVGDEMDAVVLLHELAHLWFNDDLFAGRWINEGLAEHYAAKALPTLGEAPPPPYGLSRHDPGRLQLNDWSSPDLLEEISTAEERYGYATARMIIERVAQEIGDDLLADVVQRAAAGEIAYQGGGQPLLAASTPDWRGLLDLFAEVGHSQIADDLFAEFVVSAAEKPLIDDREQARRRYAALAVDGEGWAPPAGLRVAMAGWRFDRAEDFIDRTYEILEVRDDIEVVLAGVDLDVPDALEPAYEEAKNLDKLEALVADALDASQAVAEASEAQDDSSGPLAAIGLLGSGADGELAAAQRALDEGDYAAAEESAGDAEDGYAGATSAGLLRLGILLIVSALLLLLVRRRRARRRRLQEADKAAETTSDAPIGVREEPRRERHHLQPGGGGPH